MGRWGGVMYWSVIVGLIAFSLWFGFFSPVGP